MGTSASTSSSTSSTKTRTRKTAAAHRGNGGKKKASVSPATVATARKPYALTPERQAEILEEARGIPEAELLVFPGKLARRVAWSSRIQLAAERDAADLSRTPFGEGEPHLTRGEIRRQRDRIEMLRVTQSRWQALQNGQQKATRDFEEAAAEAGQHRQTLLRFFDLRFRNDPEGQRRLTAIRAGKGDADLVQDVSDVLVLCAEHRQAIEKGPRGEGQAATRLEKLSPKLSRLLADKALSPEMLEARLTRDAVYTLVTRSERLLRAAADYWYGGTERAKEYAAFTPSATGGGRGDVEEDPEPAPAEGEDAETPAAQPS